MAAAPAYIIHNLAQAVAALTAAAGTEQPVHLYSPPHAASSMGVGVFAALAAAAQAAVPTTQALFILDCDDAYGLALAALREGIKAVRVDAAPEILTKLRDIAEQSGAMVMTDWPEDIVDMEGFPHPDR